MVKYVIKRSRGAVPVALTIIIENIKVEPAVPGALNLEGECILHLE